MHSYVSVWVCYFDFDKSPLQGHSLSPHAQDLCPGPLLTYMRRLDVMDEVGQVGELDPALVELAHVQQEDCHLAGY